MCPLLDTLRACNENAFITCAVLVTIRSSAACSASPPVKCVRAPLTGSLYKKESVLVEHILCF